MRPHIIALTYPAAQWPIWRQSIGHWHMMARHLAKKPETRRMELKRLLAQEFDIPQIAIRMGLPVDTIENLLDHFGWREFVQPGKRMKQQRKDWTARQQLMATPDQYEVMKSGIGWAKKVLNSGGLLGFPGWQSELIEEYVEDTAIRCFTNCIRSWTEGKGAQFSTYFNNIWRLKLNDIKQWVHKQYELWSVIDSMEEIDGNLAA